jgi:hypothetical protein
MSELGSIQKVHAFLREKDDSSEICRALYEGMYDASLLLARLDEVGTVLMNKISGKANNVRVKVILKQVYEMPLGTSTMQDAHMQPHTEACSSTARCKVINAYWNMQIRCRKVSWMFCASSQPIGNIVMM